MMIDWFLQRIGYSQTYHCHWVAKIKPSQSFLGDGTYIVRPRMTQSNIAGLREFIANEAEEAHERLGGREAIKPENITIVSLTRISA